MDETNGGTGMRLRWYRDETKGGTGMRLQVTLG
jgi:hypothetical protein